MALPWSTSATAILGVLWWFALIPTLGWTDVRRELATPAGGPLVLLVALGLAGVLWAPALEWCAREKFAIACSDL